MKNILGWMVFILFWSVISYFDIINPRILPSPVKVIANGLLLIQEKKLFNNIWFSVKINFMGYIMSILLALPVGFVLGLFKPMREMFSGLVDSMRFIPITALGGIFVSLAGLSIWTKIDFLAFSIIIYVIPVVVVRLEEIPVVYLQMLKTLGANRLQTFIKLQFPFVMSKLIDDIRVLVGISWSYIIIAELKNIQGGLGSLIFLGEKQSNSGLVYFVVIVIMTIGILQDILFKQLDKIIFKFKYI